MTEDPDYDDDGSPKYPTEEERRIGWAKANHASLTPWDFLGGYPGYGPGIPAGTRVAHHEHTVELDAQWDDVRPWGDPQHDIVGDIENAVRDDPG